MLTPRQKVELDRYITGNWGEDQFREEPCLCGFCPCNTQEECDLTGCQCFKDDECGIPEPDD